MSICVGIGFFISTFFITDIFKQVLLYTSSIIVVLSGIGLCTSAGWRIFWARQMTFSGSKRINLLINPEDIIDVYGTEDLFQRCVQKMRNAATTTPSARLNATMRPGIPVHLKYNGLQWVLIPAILSIETLEHGSGGGEGYCVGVYQGTEWTPTGLALLGTAESAAEQLMEAHNQAGIFQR